MQIAGYKHINRLSVKTYSSSCQGEQWDYVLIDELTSETVGFLNEPERITVKLTRAQNGLVVLYNHNMVYNKSKGPKGNFLRLYAALQPFKMRFDSHRSERSRNPYLASSVPSDYAVRALPQGFGSVQPAASVNNTNADNPWNSETPAVAAQTDLDFATPATTAQTD